MNFANQTFNFFEDNAPNEYSNHTFTKCSFNGCNFSSEYDVNKRSKAKNILFENCKVTGGNVGPGIIENCVINGLKVGNHFQTFGTVFNEVIFKGKIDQIMITPYVDVFDYSSDTQLQFNLANKNYYERISWALDISKAEFIDCDIRGIPSNLIKRDPETQIIIKRHNFLDDRWKSIDLSETYFKTSIDFFLEDGYEDAILVAPKRSSNFKKLLNGINELRKIGIAE